MTELSFAEQITGYKDDLNYTDREIAVLLDVSIPTVTRWRKGITTPMRPMRLFLLNVLAGEVMKQETP